MKDGKNVAIEVPGAMTMEEIWDLINTSEKTRKHCMQLENCVYDFFELTTLNMAQQGLFGEIMHAEGAYIHGLQPFWGEYWNNWRMDYNRKHRGDIYATHGMGPACQALNIHRGDKMNFLVSMDTKAVGNPAYIKEKSGIEVTDFRNGDHTMTMIRTEKGKTIQIQHDVTSPRPYSRMYQLSGTKGFANKYPLEGYALDSKTIGADVAPNHEKLNAHSFVPADVKKALMEKYKHPIVAGIEEKAKKVGGHGGMDFIMDYRLIYCLQNGLPLDMDVYDLAEWSCLAPLTEISLDNNSAPVEIPDFTRGGWNKLKGLEFSK
jgi:predicted dehydrogenase